MTGADPVARALAAEGPFWTRLLDERTRMLAQPHAVPVPTGLTVLECQCGAGRYALPLAALRAVVDLAGWTRLPRRGGAVLGLASVRGERRLLIDLDLLAGAAAEPRRRDRPGHAVALRVGAVPVALAVDRAEAVTRVTIDHPPSEGRFLSGMTATGMAVVDPAAIVAALVRGEA